jgi:hypothetical protein
LYYFAFGHIFPLRAAVSCLMTDYTKLFTPPKMAPLDWTKLPSFHYFRKF